MKPKAINEVNDSMIDSLEHIKETRIISSNIANQSLDMKEKLIMVLRSWM